VYAFNPRAQRAYEKAGFVVEGVFRDALLWDGQWVDEVMMSVLATDWIQSGA
jgi:RimJ/RimL family protein N-acetyltransferase